MKRLFPAANDTLASGLASGVYVITIRAGGLSRSVKAALVR